MHEPCERLIIIAPVGQDAPAMAALLESEGFQTEVLADFKECSKMIAAAGALLLTEEALELPGVSELLDALRAQPAWSELPLIILTTGGESRLIKVLEMTATAAGSVTLLERPMRSATLLRSVQVALSSRRRQYQVRDLLVQERVLRSEAEKANHSKDEFLAMVSHELRSPLNAILGWATLIAQGEVDQTTMVRAIQAIERNAKAQAKLIEDLLDVSRAISGKLRLNRKTIQLASVIKVALESANPAFKAKNVQLEASLDVDAAQVSGDEHRLQQVFDNLLSNALKFTPAGGRVQVSAKRMESHAHVTVSDNGEGITPEFLPHIFEAFRQADRPSARTHGGLGLGLAIVRRLVEMHEGTISVDSAGLGRGATFTVSLPVLLPQRTELEAGHGESQADTSPAALAATELPSLSGIRVLAVDDEGDARAMLKGVLEQLGADVLTASSAAEAVKRFRQWKPDVLVCDIGMPQEDGNVLIRKIRELEARNGQHTPAIAVTAYARPEDRLRALNSGYQRFISKPVEARKLALAIVSLVGRTVEGGSSSTRRQ